MILKHRRACSIFGVLIACITCSAQAQVTCSVSAYGVNFGEYDLFNYQDTYSVGNLSVSCTGLTDSASVAYEIQLSSGSGSFNSRTLTNGNHSLAYNVYTENNYSLVWGDGSNGTVVLYDGYGLGLSTVTKDYSVYGRIIARQNVSPGNYSDNLTVLVNY